jgi:hypothetical protein
MAFLMILAMAAVACSAPLQSGHAQAEGGLQVTATADRSVASASDPVTVTVTAENLGDSRAVWGHGSGSCRLSLLVRVGATDLEAAPPRVCTMDYVEHGLDPGESRREVFVWSGEAVRDRSVIQLDPGIYELLGAAGEHRSEPIQIFLQGLQGAE